MKVVLGWDITFSILVSSVAVALYVGLGGLRSAIFNEVLQFVLIWGGALLVPVLGMIQAGGVNGLKTKIIANMHSDTYFHLWRDTGHFAANPMGVHWTGIVLGLGFVISFGYWTTDFLVVQRVLAAHNLRAARMAPIIGSYFKMAVPFIVILPGLLGLVLLQNPDGSRRVLVGEDVVKSCAPNISGEQIGDPGACSAAMSTNSSLTPAYQANVLSAAPGTELHSYNEALPLMLVRYCGPGLLGLGVTALIAGFMSGMAGNVSAFTTVWTYDIYRPFINSKGSDHHYVNMGRWTTVIGVLISIGTAYLVMQFASIMDYVQALFSFFIAPLFGTVVLGMLWRRATGAGGFWGLLCGTLSSISMWTWVKLDPSALRYVALSPYAKGLAQDMYQALWSFVVCVIVTVVVSLATKPMPDSQLTGLVYGLTEVPAVGDVPLYQKPLFWAAVVTVVFFVLNIIFW
jgi:SSS family solute:Na+ symporter